MNPIVLLLALSFSFANLADAQTSKKNNISRFQQIQKLDITSVEKGNHLELAKELDISEFLKYYIEFGKVHNSKEYGSTSIVELYKDAGFTYFARKYSYGLLEFLKTPTVDLQGIDYGQLDGNELRKRFIAEIVPQSDKDHVLKKEKDCTAGNTYFDFKYEYRPATKEIEIKYKWKVSCDFVIKVINKTYKAMYNINQAKFE